MKLIKFDPVLHYEILGEWWRAAGWPIVSLDHLPGGYVVINRDMPVCAGFVYFTGTAFCLFEWIVASPTAGLKERAQALDVLISGVKLLVNQAGVKTIFMSMKHDGLIAKLVNDHGFRMTDQAMTNLTGSV